MPKVSPIQNDFSTGEVSALAQGRVTSDRYKQAMATCLNYVPVIQGGLTRRPGTQYIGDVKDISKFTRLIPFQYSVTQAYMLEFSNLKIRFYKNYANILAVGGGGTSYEVTTPYTAAELPDLRYTQSNDVLYLVHPAHPPAKLVRISDAEWAYQVIVFTDGPYLPINTAGGIKYPNIALTPSAYTTGTGRTLTVFGINITGIANNGSGLMRVTVDTGDVFVTGQRVTISTVIGSGGLTAAANSTWVITVISSTTFDLVGSGFVGAYTSGGLVRAWLFTSADVGRQIRLLNGSTWGKAVITGYTSTTVVTVTISSALASAGIGLQSYWRLGAFSARTSPYGYPSIAFFHEDRLYFTGVPESPQTLYSSNTSDYENMSPSATDSTITDSNGITATINSNDSNAIKWAASDEKGILLGTQGSEWVVKSAVSTQAISPTNIAAKKASSFGSTSIKPVEAGKAVLFVQKTGKKIREFSYFFDVDGFRATDMSILSEDLIRAGVNEMAFQKTPFPIIWMVRGDGALVGMTYDRDLDGLKVGWHRHWIAGVSDVSGSNAVVESIAVIPSPDGTRDDLWMTVQRWVGGALGFESRTIEVLSKFFEADDELKDAPFLDLRLTYDSPKTVVSITKASVGVVTATAHGFINGNLVRFDNVKGMTEVEGNIYQVRNKTTDTFELENVDTQADINTTAFGTYIASSGEVRKLVTTVSGLGALDGQTVDVLADGRVFKSLVIASNTLTLPYPAAVVQVGLPYSSDGKLLRIEAGAADGTALGKTKRTNRVSFLVDRSYGLQIGTNFDTMFPLPFSNAGTIAGRAPDLYTGFVEDSLESDYDYDNQICFRQDDPLPSTILAILPQLTTQDR